MQLNTITSYHKGDSTVHRTTTYFLMHLAYACIATIWNFLLEFSEQSLCAHFPALLIDQEVKSDQTRTRPEVKMWLSVQELSALCFCTANYHNRGLTWDSGKDNTCFFLSPCPKKLISTPVYILLGDTLNTPEGKTCNFQEMKNLIYTYMF